MREFRRFRWQKSFSMKGFPLGPRVECSLFASRLRLYEPSAANFGYASRGVDHCEKSLCCFGGRCLGILDGVNLVASGKRSCSSESAMISPRLSDGSVKFLSRHSFRVCVFHIRQCGAIYLGRKLRSCARVCVAWPNRGVQCLGATIPGLRLQGC